MKGKTNITTPTTTTTTNNNNNICSVTFECNDIFLQNTLF